MVTFQNLMFLQDPLWLEFMEGLGGKMAAKHFTASEKGGKSKFRYCRCKVFWDCISKHVNAAYAVNTVFTKNRNCYGHSLPVSKVLVKMTKDKK